MKCQRQVPTKGNAERVRSAFAYSVKQFLIDPQVLVPVHAEDHPLHSAVFQRLADGADGDPRRLSSSAAGS